MDAHLPSSPSDSVDDDFVAVLAEQRARLQEFGARRRQRIQDLEGDLCARVEKIAQSLDELRQDAQGKLTQAEQQGTTAEQTRAELEARLAEIERRDSQLLELNDTLIKDRAAIAARARRIAGRVRAQRRTLVEQRQQDKVKLDDSAVAEIASMRDGLVQLQAEREKLQAERDQLAVQLQARSEERDQALRELEPLRPLPAELDSIRAELNGLRGELKHDQEASASLAAERDELRTAVEAARQRQDETAKEREQLTAAASAAQESLRSLSAERDGLAVERDRLKAERDGIAVERDRLATDVSSLQGDVEQARRALADSSVQAQAVAELQAKLQQAEQERRQLQERLEQTVQTQAAELQSAKAEAAALTEELAKFRAAEQQAASEHARLHGRCEELDSALLNVKAEFDRETAQAASRVQSLERDLARAKASGAGDQQAQQELAKRFADAEAAAKQALAAQQAAETQAADVARQLEQLREQASSASHATEEVASLRTENANLTEQLSGLLDARTKLIAQCAELQERLEEAPPAVAAVDEDVAERIHALERRYELAMEDVREEKARAAELEQKLAISRKNGGTPAPSGAGMDWEAQKLRMLAMLEEYDDGDAEQARERLTIQGTLDITDSVVADKDQEIAELRKLLEEQSSNIGNVAVGASAIAQLIESDEVIQHERERARQLQTEWEGKMRTAEVEISVERAKLARERSDLEEKLRVLEERSATMGAQTPAANAAAKEPKRGRWLERLGLKDGPQG
ncbi:MAG: hypothetical protein SGJ19_09460 [Planctomycetia bacterium]|nr:hypothetical protein [Planctomycetia bacterium]